MIELIPDLPDGTVGVRMSGTVDAQEYKSILDPAIEEEMAKFDKISALIVTDPNGVDFTAGALLEDTKLGLRHPLAWTRCALVSDNDLADKLTPVLSALMPGRFRTFGQGNESEARAWLSEGQ